MLLLFLLLVNLNTAFQFHRINKKYSDIYKNCNCCARGVGSPDSFVLLIATGYLLPATMFSECSYANIYLNDMQSELFLHYYIFLLGQKILVGYFVSIIFLSIYALLLLTVYLHFRFYELTCTLVLVVHLDNDRFVLIIFMVQNNEFQGNFLKNIILIPILVIVDYKIRY